MRKFYVTDGNLQLLTTQPTSKQAAVAFCKHYAGRGLMLGTYIEVDTNGFNKGASCEHLFESYPVISTLQSSV